MIKKKTEKNKIIKSLIEIKKYDIEHFSNKLTATTAAKEENVTPTTTIDEKAQEDLKYINDNYYTFLWEPPKDKSLYFLRKPIFNFLFKYSFRQVRFNDHLRNLLSKIYEILSSNNLELKKQNSSINEIKQSITNLNNELPKFEHLKNQISKTNCNLMNLEGEILPLKDITNKNIKNIQKQIDELYYHHSWKENKLNALEEKIEILENKKIINSPYRFFSQFGEDNWIIKNIKIPKIGTYLDIGAADGVTFSNTYYFEKIGWKGICFEPDPNNYEKAKKYRSNVDNYAISNKNGIVDFYISSVSSDWSGLIKSNKFTKIIKVKSETLSEIVDQHKITKIDLLSIDTEGTELDVWNSLDLNIVRPKVVIIEYVHQGMINKKVLDAFKKSGYKLVHSTYVNHIFVDDQK